jgi:hypothetical protein
LQCRSSITLANDISLRIGDDSDELEINFQAHDASFSGAIEITAGVVPAPVVGLPVFLASLRPLVRQLLIFQRHLRLIPMEASVAKTIVMLGLPLPRILELRLCCLVVEGAVEDVPNELAEFETSEELFNECFAFDGEADDDDGRRGWSQRQ